MGNILYSIWEFEEKKLKINFKTLLLSPYDYLIFGRTIPSQNMYNYLHYALLQNPYKSFTSMHFEINCSIVV